MRLNNLLEGLSQITWPQDQGEILIEHVTIDSRAVSPGCLFVALRGHNADGHRYLEGAIANGAVAVLVDEDHVWHTDVPDDVVVLVTRDTRAVLGLVAAAFFEHPSKKLTVIGITGTNGKTTTSYMLERVLVAAGKRPGVVGTVNYRWGDIVQPAPNTTPESLSLHQLMATMLQDGVDTVILEVSSHGLETHRVVGVHFDVAVFTNLTQDHLDFHGSMEAYYKAKASFFTDVMAQSQKPNKVCIINLDDTWSNRLLADIEYNKVEGLQLQTTTTGEAGHWRILSQTHDLSGMTLTVQHQDQQLQITSPVAGAFNASNTVQAIAAAVAVGVDINTVQNCFKGWGGVPGRLERVIHDSPLAVFVDYAHTPDALELALQTLKPMCLGQLWVVFGCGGDRDQEKRPMMGQIATQHADRVVVTSDNPRGEDPLFIIEQITKGTIGSHWISQPDRQLAIEHALYCASNRDVVLIAGKGHETYQEIDGQRRPFDDRLKAHHALDTRGQLHISTWTPEQLAASVQGTWFNLSDYPQNHVSTLTTDTRKVEAGDFFVALAGERFDAHHFVQKLPRSTYGAMVSSAQKCALPQLHVADTLKGLQELASALWRSASLDYRIALTGSNGKTTTKELLRALWSHHMPTHATPGNFNNHIGVPLTVSQIATRHRCAIIEMGANGAGDIAELIEIAPADIRIITSIGVAHIEGFGDLDGVRRAKSEIFNDATADTWAIVPVNEHDALIKSTFPGKVLTFGHASHADVRVDKCIMGAQRMNVQITYRDQSFELTVGLLGEHNARNLAASVATLIAAGLSPQPGQMNLALESLHMPGGRWRTSQTGPYRWIDDAYNANPSSVLASFEAFMAWAAVQAPAEHTVAIIGEMLEIGDDAKNWHDAVIRDICLSEDLTMIICVGTFNQSMAQTARHHGHDGLIVKACSDVSEVTAHILSLHDAMIFIKASRGARLERIIENVQNVQDGLA